MSGFTCISASDAKTLMDSRAFSLVDIRDPGAFKQGRIRGARLLNNDSLADFLAEAESDQPCLVCCYHGHSSQQAAAFLVGQGFSEVYSIDGGYEGWRTQYPQHCEQ